MPLAKINQHDLYYEQHGNGGDLVLISGFTADHTVWSEMIEPLSKFYRVLIALVLRPSPEQDVLIQ